MKREFYKVKERKTKMSNVYLFPNGEKATEKEVEILVAQQQYMDNLMQIGQALSMGTHKLVEVTQ